MKMRSAIGVLTVKFIGVIGTQILKDDFILGATGTGT